MTVTAKAIFVLIMYMGAAYRGAAITHEFDNEAACIVAGKSMEKQYSEKASGYDKAVAWVCVPK